MNKLIFTNQFKKAYKEFIISYPYLQKKIDATIDGLENDESNPLLKSHKLSGKLFGLKSCSCGYDCRIIYMIDFNNVTKEMEIVLLNIGSHEIVY